MSDKGNYGKKHLKGGERAEPAMEHSGYSPRIEKILDKQVSVRTTSGEGLRIRKMGAEVSVEN